MAQRIQELLGAFLIDSTLDSARCTIGFSIITLKHRSLTLFFSILVYTLSRSKGKDGHPAAAQIVSG